MQKAQEFPEPFLCEIGLLFDYKPYYGVYYKLLKEKPVDTLKIKT
ncbi:hypothetical protein [uncultured Maribacter sp.]|jgi:hypothetical protein|nr:hypothetical protein [uncultured Maribacter sp.]